MAKNNASYYAIIPATVRYNERLSPNAKLLYGEITALCNKEGYCWASNPYFAKLYKKNVTTVSAWVSQLEREGFIYREVDGKDRKIYLRENPKGASEKAEASASEKAEHNSTRENTTTKATPSVAATDITKFFDGWAVVNPSFTRFYANKTERSAAKELIGRYGLPKLTEVVKALVWVNKLPYAPTITSPYQLERKLATLKAFFDKERAKKQSKGKQVHL